MKIGNVIGKAILSAAEPALKGSRWLVVNPLPKSCFGKGEPYPIAENASLLVYDNLGAGVGDLIGYVEGAEATQTFDKPTPIDAYNVCLIDRINYNPPV